VSRWTSDHGATHYVFDLKGNVAQYAYANGEFNNADYDAYGLNYVNSQGHLVPIPLNEPWGFGAQWGYYTDGETQNTGEGISALVFCGHRYYDPNTCRWLTRDPIGYAGGINLYAFCGNNPVNRIDPWGFCGEGGNSQQGDTDGTADDPLINNYTNGVDWWIHHARLAARDGNVAIQQTNCILDTVGGMGVGAMGGGGAGESGGGGAGQDAGEASTPIGSQKVPMVVPKGTNTPTNINGIPYSGHALDQMQGRGLMPSVVKDAVENGSRMAGRGGTVICSGGPGGATVVINPVTGVIVTAWPNGG